MVIKNKRLFSFLIASLIVEKRNYYKISHEQLAKKARVNRSIISRLESRKMKNFSFFTLYNIFSVLKISDREFRAILAFVS